MESVMHNQTQYVSKIPDKDGYRTYSDTEHKIWAKALLRVDDKK
jgi:phenylalanine-4-hydroxylase